MAVTFRAFVAFKLPPDIIDLAAGIQSALRSRGLNLRWVKPRSLHLTVKFLGDIAETAAAGVASAMQRSCRTAAPLALTVQGLGVFPGFRKPRVLWIGLGGQVDALEQLYATLETELAALGFSREKRGFKAHLTLARFKGGGDRDLARVIEELGRYEPKPFSADNLVLFKSDLRPEGAVHTPLSEVRLKAP